MAVPKKRTSVSRKGLRRAGQHHKLYRKHTMKCPNCGSLTMHGRACPSCGTYKGREIVTIRSRGEDESETES